MWVYMYMHIDKTETLLNFDDNNEVTSKWFRFWRYDKSWVSASWWNMVVNWWNNDSGWSILYDVSNLNKYTFQARVYFSPSSWWGYQSVVCCNWDFGDIATTDQMPGHHFNMTTYSWYRWASWIWNGSAVGSEYSSDWGFSWWYVYEIDYDNWTYVCTRYNDTNEVTEDSPYTHRVTVSWVGKWNDVWIWLRYWYSSENYNYADRAKIITYS